MDLKERADKLFAEDRFATEAAGIVIEAVDVEHVRCKMDIRPFHLNAAGVVMGGAIFTLADYAFAIASNQKSMTAVSVASTIEFLRPATGPVLIAESACLKEGRNVCFYEIIVYDGEGRAVAKVTTTGFRRDDSTDIMSGSRQDDSPDAALGSRQDDSPDAAPGSKHDDSIDSQGTSC